MSTSLYTPIFPTSEAISAKLESLQEPRPKASPTNRKLPDSIGVARTRARTRNANTVNGNASLHTSTSSTTISTATSSSRSSSNSAKLASSHTSSALKTPSTSKAASNRPSTSKTKPTPNAKKQKRHHYGSKLRKMHLALSQLPHELAPPSPTQSYASLPLPLVNGRSNGPVPLAGDSSSIPGLPLAPRTPKTNDTRANNTKEGTITPDTTGDNRVDPKYVEDLTRKIRHAIRQANDDPTSAKWTHVHALVRMGCTTGRWLGVTGGLTSAGRDRAGPMLYEQEEEEAGEGEEEGEGPKRTKWLLAETEEEWEEWEKQREEERKRRDAKGKGKASAFPSLPSAPASALGPAGTVILAGGASRGKIKQGDDAKGKSKKTDEASTVAKKTPAVRPAATATTGSTSTIVNPKTSVKATMKPRSSATATTATTSIITGDTSSTTRPQATSTSVTSATTAYPFTSILTSPLASRTESVPANGLAPVAAAATVTPAPAQPAQTTDETPAPAPVPVPLLPPASSQADDIFGVPSTSQRIRAEVGRWKSSLTVQQQKKMDEIVRTNAVSGEVLQVTEEEMVSSSQSQPQSQDPQPQAQAQGKKQSPLEFAVRKQGAVANAVGNKKDGNKDKVKVVGKASRFFDANDVGPVAGAAAGSSAGRDAHAGDKEAEKEVEKELHAEAHDETPDKSEGKAKEVEPEVEDEAQAQAEEAEVEAETQTDDATDAPKVSSIYDVPETFIPPSFSSDSILPSTPANRVAVQPTEEPKTKPPPIAPVPDVLAGLEGELEKDGVVYPATQPSQAQHANDLEEVDEHDERVARAKKRARSSILESPSKRSRLSPDSPSEDESSSINGHGGREDNRMGTSLATSEVEPDVTGEQAEGEGALEGAMDTQDSTPPGLGLVEKKDKGKARETKSNGISLFGGQGPAIHDPQPLAPQPLALHAPQPTRPHAASSHQLSPEPSDPEGNLKNHVQERPHTPPPRPPTRVLGAAASPFSITTVPLGAPLTPSRPPKVLHLLASSRTSRPRPRPPSRHGNRTPGPAAKDKEGECDELPRFGVDTDRPRTPDRSQSAIFSSPASGSTVSTASPNLRRGANMYMGGPESPLRERGRRFTSSLNFETSPPRLGSGAPLGATGSGLLKDVMPASDFTSLSGVFDPQMVSTQQRRNGESGDIFPKRRAFAGMGESQSLPPSQEPSQDYGFSQSQGYGLGGMGYSSQFDVEGGVAETSVVLERDVDYGAWLRESPDLPDEKSVNEEKEVEEQVDMELA